MTAVRGIRNWRGWRKVGWLSFGVVFCVAAVIVFFPNSLLNQRVAAGLTDYLVKQLGPAALCGEVELGWQRVTINDIIHIKLPYLAEINREKLEADLSNGVHVTRTAVMVPTDDETWQLQLLDVLGKLAEGAHAGIGS